MNTSYERWPEKPRERSTLPDAGRSLVGFLADRAAEAKNVSFAR
ncbi:hypothetical protein [Gulosibacter bifidus]|uniref:Uncharacterized protein n=1 Tax=Gulosibacter bifidus TaxID=272239 RepID=A0ABW5RLE8_9MICO|nr:hypothetical protein [Gulosibacter bifidus]